MLDEQVVAKLSGTIGRMKNAVDGFAGSESGRTQCARRVRAMDGPQQRTGMYSQRVLEKQFTT